MSNLPSIAGREPVESRGAVDSTREIVESLDQRPPDLFVTSGHATERDWRIGYRYRAGSFRSRAGSLFGVDLEGNRWPVHSPRAKVYLAVGNCLMGHIDGPDAMALAWLRSAGVRQLAGYTVPTWYGYAGWGLLDYFLEQPGRFSLSEAVRANRIALEHRLQAASPEAAALEPEPGQVPSARFPLTGRAARLGVTPQDVRGLLHDRDVLAFYGDPGWEARLEPGPLRWRQRLREEPPGRFTLEITPRAGPRTFEPVDTNGSQRGGRPIIAFLPRRLPGARVIEGEALHPLVADDFVLVPLPREAPGAAPLRVVFREVCGAPER